MNRRAFFARLTAALAALLAPLKVWGEEPEFIVDAELSYPSMADVDVTGGMTVTTEWVELTPTDFEPPIYRSGVWLKTNDGGWRRMKHVGGNRFVGWEGEDDDVTIHWHETP